MASCGQAVEHANCGQPQSPCAACLTHGRHNASLCDAQGIVLFREDIGRHNAIVGQCLLESRDTSRSLILSTGRIASEIVQKVVRSGIPLMVSTEVSFSPIHPKDVYHAIWSLLRAKVDLISASASLDTLYFYEQDTLI